jgi:hypothetical protein
MKYNVSRILQTAGYKGTGSISSLTVSADESV